MRTLIQGGWVVGYDGRGHELVPNGCAVFEDDRVVHVGARFDGPVDRRIDATGKLVSPGLVNCHLHAATNAGQAVFLDGLKADYFGSNFVGYVAPRRGASAPRAGRSPRPTRRPGRPPLARPRSRFRPRARGRGGTR